MKNLLLALLILSLMGCATLSYQAPDGTKVTYSRFLTGSDSINGKAGAASIDVQKQRGIDPATLQAILSVLGTVK